MGANAVAATHSDAKHKSSGACLKATSYSEMKCA